MVSNRRQMKEIILLTILFIFMFQIYRIASHTNILKKVHLVDIPYSIKCFFNGPLCEEGDLDGWSLLHGSIFLVVGFAMPKRYLLIIIFSVLFEFVRFHFGYESRPIINPLVNLTGYIIGSFLNDKSKTYREKYQVLER
ncbi:MAG: hypothetical protein QW303_06525 [Nitrososphaerota archaeon]